jgi:hypothetical protein
MQHEAVTSFRRPHIEFDSKLWVVEHAPTGV